MTDPDPRPLTGQDIGRTERAIRAVLDRLLEETGTSFHQGVALQILATSGGAVEVDRLVRDMGEGLKVGASIGHATIGELRDLGLVAGDAELRLTAAGEHRVHGLLDGIAGITRRLYADIPEDDLVTARRVLARVADHANAELAGGHRAG